MFDHNSPLDFFDVLYTNTFQDVRIQTYESCDMLYGSKIKKTAAVMRLGLISVSLPSRIFRLLRETGFFWRGDVECVLILPSDYLQLYCHCTKNWIYTIYSV